MVQCGTMTRTRETLAIILLSAALAVALLLRAAYLPTFDGGMKRASETDAWESASHPLWLWEPSTDTADFFFSMRLKRWHPERFRIIRNGELQKLSVNGRDVPVPEETSVVDFGTLLVPGRNTIEGTIQSFPQPYLFIMAGFLPTFWNPGNALAAIACAFLAAAAAFLISRRFALAHRWIPWVMSLGAFTRVLYVSGMPYWRNAYDWSAHEQYVSYVAHTGGIPAADFGWETYQPPLYYFLSAAWLQISTLVRPGFGSLQILSLFFSIATLAAGLWIATLLWRKHSGVSGTLEPAVFGILLAVFPGIIFPASQISNDVLWIFLAFVATGFLIRWCLEQSNRDWWLASLCIGIAILAKSNAILLLPAAVMAVACAKIPAEKKFRLLCILAATVAVVAGWLWILRFGVEGERLIVGNVDQSEPVLAVPRSVSSLITFNPFQVFSQPFLSDISDVARRQYLLEYLFRSAQFAHHRVAPVILARMLLVAGMAAAACSVLGMLRRRKDDARRMLLVLALSLFLGVLIYRWMHPFSSNQHFRFIVPILIPVAAFAADALTQGGERARTIALSVLLGYAALSLAVVLRLSTAF